MISADEAARERSYVDEGVLFAPRTLDTVRVVGPDRLSWLNGLVTQNVVNRHAGDAAFALAVAKSGKIESEVVVLFGEEDILLGVSEGQALVEKLDRHLIMEDAAITLEAPGPMWTFALGHRAGDALVAARQAGARCGLSQRAGVPVAMIASADRASIDALMSAIVPSAVATAEVWERCRVRLGIAERGIDYGTENYPQEAALERDEVSFEKGCYLGQEAVFMLEKRGHVQKRLVQLESAAAVARGAPITDADGKAIGEVTTSIEWPPGALTLGYVKYKYARPGREVLLGGVPARITPLLALTPE